MSRRYAFSRPDRQPASSGFRRAMGLGCRFAGMYLSIVMASPVFITPCRAAGLVIEALSSSALPGSSGSFDIVLINTNATGGTSYNVAADTLDISLSGPAGVTITDVTMSTSANYFFLQSLDADYGLPLATINTPPTSFTSNDAGDVVNGYPGYQVVNPGETYGLAHVDYTASTTSIGLDTISINSINVGTSLSDDNGDGIAFAPVNGTLIIGSGVPEPSALIQGATALLIGLGALGCRRRSAGSRCGGLHRGHRCSSSLPPA
jgi:hypothetical protein